MKNFNSLAALAFHIAGQRVVMVAALQDGLKAAATIIERTARDELGVYQPEVGPFVAWEQLTEETQLRRLDAGYTQNDPLLASGEMRASLGHQVNGLEATIGSTDDKAPYHEFGTARMPARPFLGPAGFRNRDTIKKLVGAAALCGLIGSDRVHEALGYDFETGE